MSFIDVSETVAGSVREWELVLSEPGKPRKVIHFQLPASLQLPPNLDFALCALIHPAMHEGHDVRLRGTASRRLLANLHHYAAIWAAWRPDLYRRIAIEADEEAIDEPGSGRAGAVLPLSGGVDSTASLIRHATGRAGRDTLPIGDVVLFWGFDFLLDEIAAFERRKAAVVAQAKVFDLAPVVVRTDCRDSALDWRMEFGASLAAILHLFSARHSHGLVASDASYDDLGYIMPWGNNPLTIPLLSGAHLTLRQDGGDMTRGEKAELVASMPQVADLVRVCFAPPRAGDNCGVCSKCVRTQLDFMARGLDPRRAFPGPLTVETVRRITLKSDLQRRYLSNTLADAAAHGIKDKRFDAAAEVIAAGLRGDARWRWRRLREAFTGFPHRLARGAGAS